MAKRRKPVTAEEGIADIHREMLERHHAPRTSPDMVVGAAELCWRRGEHAGMARVMFWLQAAHPAIAREMQEKYRMDAEGNPAT